MTQTYSNSAAEVLADALERDDAGAWWAGLKRSDEIEPDAFGRLLEAGLASENRLIRVATPKFVVSEQRKDMVPALVRSAKAFDDSGACNAIWAIGELGVSTDEAHELLRTSLRHHDKHRRTRAAQSIGKLGACDDVGHLANAANDPVVGVRLAAVEALAALDCVDSVIALEKIVEHSGKWMAATSAIDGLTRSPQRVRSLEALRRLASGPKRRRARYAAKALVRLEG